MHFLPLGGRPSFSLFLARAFKATEAYEEKGGFLCNNNMHSITFIPPSAARQPFYISREKTLPTGKCFKTVPKQFFAHKKIYRYAGNYSAGSTRRRISCRSPLVGRRDPRRRATDAEAAPPPPPPLLPAYTAKGRAEEAAAGSPPPPPPSFSVLRERGQGQVLQCGTYMQEREDM